MLQLCYRHIILKIFNEGLLKIHKHLNINIVSSNYQIDNNCTEVTYNQQLIYCLLF